MQCPSPPLVQRSLGDQPAEHVEPSGYAGQIGHAGEARAEGLVCVMPVRAERREVKMLGDAEKHTVGRTASVLQIGEGRRFGQ